MWISSLSPGVICCCLIEHLPAVSQFCVIIAWGERPAIWYGQYQIDGYFIGWDNGITHRQRQLCVLAEQNVLPGAVQVDTWFVFPTFHFQRHVNRSRFQTSYIEFYFTFVYRFAGKVEAILARRWLLLPADCRPLLRCPSRGVITSQSGLALDAHSQFCRLRGLESSMVCLLLMFPLLSTVNFSGLAASDPEFIRH